ncbi:MAG: hypothetical protein JXB50_05635 [Spirochaetes bacterium]|nr:hypothetical protein [Spirochaetota bacterium]
MKKVIILFFLIILSVNCYTEENTNSDKYKAWHNLYWSMYFSSIGYTITYTSTCYIYQMIDSSLNNTLTDNVILNNTLFFVLQLLLIDPLVAIPTVGAYISSSCYFTSGVLQLIFYSLQINNVKGINEGIPPENILTAGLMYLINSIILVPFSIVQQVSKHKMKKIKKNKIINLNFNIYYNFINKNDLGLAISFNF